MIVMDIRPATRDKLGAVKIGNGFKITEEGLLTVDENLIERDEYIEFTRSSLEKLFKASKSRRRKV